MAEPIKVEGLKEFQRSLKAIDSGLPKMLRLSLNRVGQIIVDDAGPRIPRRTGRAQKSLKARSTQTKLRITAGGNKAPHFPWLDFGGKRKGRGGGVAERPFEKRGRYVWKSFGDKRSEVQESLDGELKTLAQQAGLEVT